MKKIIVDVRCIFDSGIGVYIREMLLSLSNKNYVIIEIIILPEQLPRFNSLNIRVQKVHCVNFSRFSWRNLFFMKKIVARDANFFMPALAIPPLNIKAQCISTVHDVCPVKMWRFFGLMSALSYWLILLLQIIISDRVIVISRFTMKELATLYPVYLMRKVRIIHNGVSRRLNKFKAAGGGADRSKPYLLCVGNIKPHKNVVNFVNFFSFQSKLSFDYDLVIVGQSGGFRTGDDLNKEYPPSVTFTGFVSDDELARLYSDACAFIYPSLYEGFGLPLFEAMLFELPIMAANIEVFYELVGDSVSYFDPYSFGDFDDSFDMLLSSPVDKYQYRQLLSHYSWDKSVDEFLKEIYQ